MVPGLISDVDVHAFWRVLAVCFLSRHGDHRDLHSFPTRRSSDLSSPRSPPRIGRRSCAPSASSKGRRVRTSDARSEEHTSELQSHSDLVCRLLLEKKKEFTEADL